MIQNVSIDLCGLDTHMPHELLDCTNVATRFEQVGCEAVTKGVTGHGLPYTRSMNGRADVPLHGLLM